MHELNVPRMEGNPIITFDQDLNVFEISGNSLPAMGALFFKVPVEWVRENGRDCFDRNTRFVFKVEYFNSCSMRGFTAIIQEIQSIGKAQSFEPKWVWYHEDEYGKEEGAEFGYDTSVDFQFILAPSLIKS